MNFFLSVSNGLLSKKHLKNMGASVWLFMWLLDKVTSINEQQIGSTNFGKPITYERVKEDLGISRATYVRWLDTLRDAGYITTYRTPVGMIIQLHKAKKIFGKAVENSKSDVSKMNSDVAKVRERCVNSATSNNNNTYNNTYTNKDSKNKEAVEKSESIKDHRGRPSPTKELIKQKLKKGGFEALKQLQATGG